MCAAHPTEPLGKLTEQQIEKGMGVLEELEGVLSESPKARAEVERLSSSFYSLIPTVFGRQRPPPIDTLALVEEKKELLKFWLRMGFEEPEEEGEGLTPIHGIFDLPIPQSLKEAAVGLCRPADIASSETKGRQCASNNAGKPAAPMPAHYYAALLLYTSNAIYQALNKVLRDENRKAVKRFFQYLRLFFAGFKGLPAKAVTLWRGISVDLHDHYRAGETVTWWGVSSCTADKNVALNFMQGCGGKTTLFTIDAKTACDIQCMSFYSHEKESLLAPGTQLHVNSVKREGNITHIHLTEVGSAVS